MKKFISKEVRKLGFPEGGALFRPTSLRTNAQTQALWVKALHPLRWAMVLAISTALLSAALEQSREKRRTGGTLTKP